MENESRESSEQHQKTSSVETSEQTLEKKSENTSNTFEKIFKFLTDNELQTVTTYDSFTKWLHRPVDGAALGVFRMGYGKKKQKQINILFMSIKIVYIL